MRPGSTLIELVVVVLILGILAGVGAPKMFTPSTLAKDNNIRHCLSVVRDAIDQFNAKHGRLPGSNGSQTTFKNDLEPFLRRFPVLAAGKPHALDDQVVMDGAVGPVQGVSNPTEGWRYYYRTGVFIVNSNKKLASDKDVKYDNL